MSGKNESLPPADSNKSAEIRTLATDISLKVIGSGARGAPASICLYTSENRYIFNCGESMQRINNEHKNNLCKLTKIDNVFITTPVWKNIGGLPGFLLCLQQYGVSNLNIHGPTGTIDIVEATKNFVRLKSITVTEANISKSFVDNVLTINYVPLEAQTAKDDVISSTPLTDNIPVEDNIDYYAYESNKGEKRKAPTCENNVKRIKREAQLVSGRVRSSMCYIGKIHPRIGKLNLEKCVEKGVKPGPLLGQLKNGKDITLSNGTVIKSVDVVDPPDPGPVFIVVDCPREELLESLINNPIFEKHQTGSAATKDMIALCVIHFTAERILKDDRYRKWMEKFGCLTQHMIVNESNTCLGTEAIHRVQHQFHLLHDEIFPFLNESNIPVVKHQNPNKSEALNNCKVMEAKDSTLIHRVKTLHNFSLYPHPNLHTTLEVRLCPHEYLEELYSVEGFLDALAEVQKNIKSMQKSLGEIPEYPKLVVLGTSSTANNKMRNTSGLLLRIDKDTSIMMDCGEGTVHQIFRLYGKETNNILATIKAIYISHLHADHQLGLIGVLQERSRATDKPVYLLAPEKILSWLYFYDVRYENISKMYILLPNSKLLLSQHEISPETEKELYETLIVKDISTVYVKHCASSFGVAITLVDDKKIVYSGDTMPCENLEKLGSNCDLLIHESTFATEDTESAETKRHSTVTQAIEMGEKMNAKFTLLTHFSQRFSKTFYMPEFGDRSDCSKIGMAFDNMIVKLAEFPILPLFYPCLKIMHNAL